MKISTMAESITPSKGRALFNLASQYEDVINLTLGDPDIIPPLSIREAGCSAIMGGKTRYSANAGLYDLRNAYAKYIEDTYNKNYNPLNQVMVSVGGMEALYLAILCSINPNDEVIIFSPYYINYYQMIEMCGGKPVIVKTEESDGYVPRIELLKKKITEKTKLIIMNSPSNPTGAVYPKEVIDGIINLAKENGVALISDEVYSSLVFSDEGHYSVLQSDISYEDMLVVDSCSKKFSMTGWRVGFAIGPDNWIAAMIKLQENIAACAPLPSQYAALEAFNNMPDMDEYKAEFQERRDYLVERLSKVDKLSFRIPKGTFYLFINIKETGMKSLDFAINLLKEERVAVVPGVAYGDDFDDYVRIAFTLEKNTLGKAVDRIEKFVNKISEI